MGSDSPGFKFWLIGFVTLNPGLNFSDPPFPLHCKILPTSWGFSQG